MSDPTFELGALGIGRGEGIGASVRLLSDAVPDVLDELEALSDRQVALVERGLAHGENILPPQLDGEVLALLDAQVTDSHAPNGRPHVVLRRARSISLASSSTATACSRVTDGKS